ncbi:myb-like protein X [Lucilia sericata]|uniref:myb-like protein X n=1 Tax=Lucilia sericata TaxID=13632 RepID=UPI0018A7FB4E|nr:myb-like protein X [Lucilia sericata]
MLNKLKFNNLVISNKKGIQQSRIQTINKLVHKIRKLKTLLEKHPDNTKCKERIRKSTETMELLKKLKRMDIMKKVLLLDKPAPAVITNGLATPEEVGVALLCMNKVMQGLIKRFKTELQLNEPENEGWREALMESSKRRQKIERTEEKRRKRLEMKQQKAMGRKRQEWLEENKQDRDDEELDTNDKDVNVSTTGAWQVEELSNESVKAEVVENIEKKTNKQLKRERPVKENPKKITPANKKQKLNVKVMEQITKSDEEEEVDAEEESESETEIKTIKKNKEMPKKVTPANKKQKFNVKVIEDVEGSGDESDDEPEIKTMKENKHKVANNVPVSEEEDPEEEEMVVDPFFITDTGENYLSTAVIKRNQNNENDNEEKRDLHMIKLNNYDKKSTDFKDRREQNRDRNQRDFNQNRPQNNNWNKREEGREHQNKWQQNRQTNNGRDGKFSQNKWNDRKKTDSRQDFKHKAANTNVEENLHPSWAAKQKLKPVITGFQGKKITFGDEDDNGKQTQQQTFNKTQTPKSVKSDQDLHPSWAAKQKLKPAITVFQGKKITFDNDE